VKELIHQYGAWIVFVLVFLESIGVPLPGEAILVSAAILPERRRSLASNIVALRGASFREAVAHFLAAP
jgi:membrane protein DedA with SNARE-associated domain